MPLLRLLAVLALSVAQAIAAPPTEDQVKAAFLYNFAQFVEWPATAFANDQAPFVIGVLGEDPFNGDLDAIVRDERVASRPLVVRRYRNVAEIDNCQILFISSSETTHLEQILGALKGRSILTVSDTEGFAKSGGMIHFVTERNRIRLRISVDAATASHLAISSKLLRLAEIVPQGRT